MNRERLESLRNEYRDGLLRDTLPFWIRHGVDRDFGGIMTFVNRDGTRLDTDKGVWQQGRFCWLMGELFNSVEPREDWLELATSTAAFLRQHCFDPVDGRMWFHVTRDGVPIRKRRYSYSESFAAIAFGELAQATGQNDFRDLAVSTFERFREHTSNPAFAAAKFTDARPSKSIGFPMIALGTAQELRDSIGLENAEAIINCSIEEIVRDFVKPDLQCVMEQVAPDGSVIEHTDGRTLNPGHAIEAAWFIMREGQHRCDQALIQIGCQMLDWMWERGWDRQFGGMLYFTDLHGAPVQEYWHDMKFWWPHNETIIATLLAWSLTRDEKYAARHQLVHDWAVRYFADPEFGEWFGYLRRDGTVSNPAKGNLWKGAFHLPRMQLTCWRILDAVLEPDGKSFAT